MKRIILSIILIFVCLPFFNKFASASENNKYGIHLAIPSDEDLESAAGLVNSGGGDWGYVTLVMQSNDLNFNKWQGVFDRLRELHLIPIIRLATEPDGGNWRKPQKEEAQKWADFLGSLNWVVKERYVVLFNEPNHASEWGGQVDPENYAEVVAEYIKTLKNKNSDFKIMLSGFDAAAPQKLPDFADEEVFLKRVFNFWGAKKEEIGNLIDYWASHSYPNHGFVGSPQDQGRHSVRGYLWELSLIKNLGMTKNLSVFITETGWPHAEGESFDKKFQTQEKTKDNFAIYFREIISDPNVVAVTPFVLNYQSEPFDHFSWKKKEEIGGFYPQFTLVQNLLKVAGNPVQENKLEINSELPGKLVVNSTYQIPLLVKNTGQSIWEKKERYFLKLENCDCEYFFSEFDQLKPFEETLVFLYLKTNEKIGKKDLKILTSKGDLYKSNEIIWPLELSPRVKISFKVSLMPKRLDEGNDFKLLIYDLNNQVVFEEEKIQVKNGKGVVENVRNMILGEKYRLVLLKPYYLPRQQFLIIKESGNEVVFEMMLPLDFNEDGKFSIRDVLSILKKPSDLKLWFP